MKVRFADVGDPLAVDPFRIGRFGARLRGPDNGSGGGTSDADKDKDTGAEDDTDDDADDTDDTDDDADDKDENKKDEDPELKKAIARRDRALARARKAEAALAAATKKEGEAEEDPQAKANAKIVRSTARTLLAGAGVTEKEDQTAVLAVLRLDDIEVDDEGDPDEDAIEERITELRRIFGGKPAPQKRVPKGVSSKDKGGTTQTTDPDSIRYKKFMGLA